MKFPIKSTMLLSILTIISILSIPTPTFTAEVSTITRIMVTEGKVICFEIPEEISVLLEKQVSYVVRFLERIDIETGKVDIRGEIALCYIPQEYRDQISDRLKNGVYVLLLKNTRRIKQTEWDIIAVGTVVGAGQEFYGGMVKEILPNITQTSAIPSKPAVDKVEQSIAEGEGSGTPTPEPPTPTTPPTEPTPPEPTQYTGPDYYVNPNGSDGNDGSSSNPWCTITYALSQIESGTIHLEPGIYKHNPNIGEIFPLNMKSNVNISGANKDTTILDGGGTSGIIYTDSVSNVTIENLTTQNGTGVFEELPFGLLSVGGSICCVSSSTITIDNCNIIDNTAENVGGGIFAYGNFSITISNSYIARNQTTDITTASGGGVFFVGGATSYITLENCIIEDNISISGGGISGQGSCANIYRCIIRDNNASSNGGGGVDVNDDSTFNIVNSLFVGNIANGNGGAVLCETRTTLSMTNCTMVGNTSVANQGGGVGCESSTMISTTLKNCIISNSTGWGVWFEAGAPDPTITTCIFNSSSIANYNRAVYPDTDPLFKGASDYHIGVGSPCRNAGTTDGAPSDDLEGRPRTSPPDIGCYEYITGDPPITGRVYDSVTGENISEPVVGIYNATTNAQVGVTTDNPFTFNVDPGRYYFAVSKDGYAFPSQIVASTTSGDHGDIFTASNDPLTINIPMDPDGWLYIEKTCNKERVETGDIVTYRIKVQNKHWYKSVENVELVDELVNGFKYVGSPSFNLGTISANSTQTISYQVRVGSGIPPGRYKTSCYTRKSTTGARNSNIDSTEIEVIENPLFTKGTIIGKVFWDENGNGIQDNTEPGISNVKIFTEYGVEVETDKQGKYHIANVPAGNHLLKVDNTSFPPCAKFTTDNPYYVKITEGLLAKANFGLTAKESTVHSPQSTEKSMVHGPWSMDKFFIVALGEGTVRNLDTSGNIEMLEKDDRYDDGLKVDGRLALYLKGKILGKYLIKASIDTERRPKGRYDSRKLFTNLDPDKYYPVYGDASKVDYSGVDTQDVVYVIIEWDESFAKWGSFHTELPLYNRTLSGGIINYQSVGKTKFGDTRTKIKGFGAFARQKPAHDEFIGTGGSLYYLRHDNIIEGSEKLKVEVRDRIGRITVNSIPLVEEKDYEIDYDTGRILLKRPLNSIQQSYNNSIISNDILMGERVYLVIDYEYYSDGLSDQAYGVNASQWLGNHIRVCGTYVEEQKTGDPYKLMGGDGTIKINKDTEVNVNYSRSEETQLGSTISYDGGLTFTEQGEQYSLGKSGNAITVDGRTKLFNNTDISLTYSRQDPYYSVTNSISSQGSQKYLGNIVTKLTENLSVGLTHLTQKYFSGSIAGETFGATDSYTTTGILDYRPGKWDIRTEYQHQEIKNPITDYTYFGTLPLLANDFIAARIGYQLFSWLHPYIRGQVTVNGDANDQGTVGTDINIGGNTTINLAETIGTLGDSSLIGLTTKITEGTDVYANLEVGNHTKLGKFTKTTYGQSTQLSPDSKAYVETDYSSYRENVVRGNLLGYNKKITDTLGLGLTYERSNVKNNTTAIDRDSGGISLTYLNPDWLKAATKLELRNDIGSSEIRQWVTQNDILWRTTEWLELSGRCNWAWTNNEDTDTTQAEFYEIGTGFSIRPVTWDKLNILGKYSYLTDLPPDSKWDFPDDIESIKNVYSIEGIYDLFKYLSLVGKFSYRDMSEKVGTRDWTDSDTYLYIARTNFHIMNSEPNKPFILRGWDFAIEYRILANDQIEDQKEGFLLELDKDLGQYIRCGIGYNFTDYDDDLRNEDNWDSKGWFFKIAGKY